MKILITSTLVVLLSVCLADAIARPRRQDPSTRVELEASQLLKSVDIRGLAEANNLMRFIQVRIQIHNSEFIALKNRVDEQLSQLGNAGREFRSQLNVEAQKLVDSVNQQVSSENLKPKVLNIISSLSQYTETIKTDIDDLKNAIQTNPENVKCWHENKGELRSFINNFLREAQNITRNETRALSSKIQDVVSSTNDYVSQLKEKLESECFLNTSCYVDYFKNNLPEILNQLSGVQSQISTDINETLANILSGTSNSFKEAMSSDYEDIKQKVTQCIK